MGHGRGDGLRREARAAHRGARVRPARARGRAAREPPAAPASAARAASTSTCPSTSRGSDPPRDARRRRRGPSRHRRRRRGHPPRRRQRRGRRAGGDVHVVRLRADAHRARGGRLHAGRRRRAAEPVLLDFFVEAPGRGLPPGTEPAPLRSVDVDFGDAVQAFNIGAVGGRHLRRGRPAPPRPPSASAGCRWPRSSAPAVRAGARRRRGQRAAGVPVRDPRADLRGDGGVARPADAGGRAAAGRRRAPRPGARRRARAARRRGSGAVLHRRRRGRGRRTGSASAAGC